MIPFKLFKSIIVSTALVSLLGGCVTNPPGTNSDMAAPTPVPKSQELEYEQQPGTVPSGQTAQNTYPAQISSRQSVFEPKESNQIIKMVPVSYADMGFVQQRFYQYQIKLDQWLNISEIDEAGKLAGELSKQGIECVQLLERILTGYSLLLDRMQQNETVPVDKTATVDPKRMQQLDISFLESRCSEILTKDTPAEHELTAGEELQPSFNEAQRIIISHVNNGDYQEAILEYSNLSQNYPEQKPTIFTQLSYGFALQYSGQVEAAARHFSKMLASGDLSVEPLSLQLEIADLLLASGNFAAAESHYESFILAHKSIEAEKSWAMEQLAFLRSASPESDDMLAYTNLLREFQIYDYRIHSVALNEKINTFTSEHAGKPLADKALRLKTFTIEQLNSWFGRQLVKIDFLVAGKNYTEAIDILKNMTRYYLPADLQAIVQKTYYEVAQAELQETENQQLIQEMELTEQWDAAVLLMDSQRFDEAIFAFEALMGTKYEEKATTKIVEAANLGAGQMRKEAASLFIRAGKTPDFEEKKVLLLDSYKMLNEIVFKFPQTDLLDKVHQNIAILEEQIRKIDPALLEELQEGNPSLMPEESPDPFSGQVIQ